MANSESYAFNGTDGAQRDAVLAALRSLDCMQVLTLEAKPNDFVMVHVTYAVRPSQLNALAAALGGQLSPPTA